MAGPKVRRPPSRAETDAEVDRRLAKAGWLDVDDLDEVAVDLHKETLHEYVVLRHVVRRNPTSKTPAVADRLDQLRRDLREQMADLGMTPAARKGLGLAPSSVSLTKRGPGLTYRQPAHQREIVRMLVTTGVWDAVAAGVRRDLATQQNHPAKETHDGEKDTTGRSAAEASDGGGRSDEQLGQVRPLRAARPGQGLDTH